jgi:hypothetical protein
LLFNCHSDRLIYCLLTEPQDKISLRDWLAYMIAKLMGKLDRVVVISNFI